MKTTEILFHFNKQVPNGGGVVRHCVYFDGTCVPVLNKIGEKQDAGPMFIGRADERAFTNLAEPLAHYTRFATGALRASQGDLPPLAEPTEVLPERASRDPR